MKEGVDLPGGDDDGKGPSSPRPKRLRISVQSNAVDGDDREFQGSFSDCFNPNREQKGKHCEDEGEQETYEEEERYSDDEEGEHEEEESYSDDEEGGHEEEEEGYSDDEEEDPGSTVTVRPRSNGGAQVGRDGSISVTLTDPEVLDCYICFEHLSSPVFQCENGHIACSSCCIKLRNKCPSCCLPIGYIRCPAIEKVLESAKISCPNTKYGCNEAVGYSKEDDHEKTCIYAPCSCPLLDCNFIASSKQVYKHFSRKHPNSAISFLYDCAFSVSLNVNDKYLVLQEQNDNALFVLNNRVELLGNLVTVCCIGPCSSTTGFPSTVRAKIDGSSLRLRSFTKNSQNWVDEPPSTGFLIIIPSGFFGSCGQLKFDICIKRNAACSE